MQLVWLWYQYINIRSIYTGTPLSLRFLNNGLWFTLSKALLASRKHTNTLPFRVRYKSVISFNTYVHWSVPCFFLKPNWFWLVSKNISILPSIITSIILLNTLANAIGRELSLEHIFTSLILNNWHKYNWQHWLWQKSMSKKTSEAQRSQRYKCLVCIFYIFRTYAIWPTSFINVKFLDLICYLLYCDHNFIIRLSQSYSHTYTLLLLTQFKRSHKIFTS